MPDEPSSDRKGGFPAFWTTLPGILTGLAALITAIVGAVGVWLDLRLHGRRERRRRTHPDRSRRRQLEARPRLHGLALMPAETAPSGFEPLSDASTLSAHDLSEAIDELRRFVRRLQP
jgi:hypothetical protein